MARNCKNVSVILKLIFFSLNPDRNVSGPRNPGRSVWMGTICPLWRKTYIASSPCACESLDVPKWRLTSQASSMNARSLIMLIQKSTCAACLASNSLVLWRRNLRSHHWNVKWKKHGHLQFKFEVLRSFVGFGLFPLNLRNWKFGSLLFCV